jgi:hypothetical protein
MEGASMLRISLGYFSGFAVCALLSTTAFAGGRSEADYPLRVHIFQHNSHSHYSHQVLESVDGEGRANLFENGQPRGFDYSYRCGERLRNSPGYETYLARWKKQDQTLEILLPKMGKPGAMEACEVRVEMKDFAYYKHDGTVDTEPATAFKQWMEKNQYDPEYGKTEPITADPQPAGAGANAPQ